MMLDEIQAKYQQLQSQHENLYDFLNHFRDWFNAHVSNYEIFLEDNWFETYTTIEYTLRCLDTFNIEVFAEDEYQNSRDAKGVWHLGHYITTRWTVEDPWQVITAFISQNTLPIR